jgi:hypothetical protein
VFYADPGACLAASVLDEVMALLADAILTEWFAILVKKLYRGVERTETSILDIHGHIFILLRVCAAEEFTARRHIDIQKTTCKLSLDAAEYIQLLICDVHESLNAVT